MDYWPIITAIGGIGVVVVGFLTYIFHERQLKLNGLLEAFNLLNNERHREARKDLYSYYEIYKKTQKMSAFNSSQKAVEDIEIVRADFDQMGMLVKRRAVLKDAFLEAYGFNAYQCWEMLKDHIAHERSPSERGFEDYMRNFEYFAQEAFDYWWKKEGVILKPP